MFAPDLIISHMYLLFCCMFRRMQAVLLNALDSPNGYIEYRRVGCRRQLRSANRRFRRRTWRRWPSSWLRCRRRTPTARASLCSRAATSQRLSFTVLSTLVQYSVIRILCVLYTRTLYNKSNIVRSVWKRKSRERERALSVLLDFYYWNCHVIFSYSCKYFVDRY